jgi:molecular chaperone GrpE
MMQEVVADKPMNTVTRELQKGYMIHDRLLRPALVGVSKTGDAATTDDKQ